MEVSALFEASCLFDVLLFAVIDKAIVNNSIWTQFLYSVLSHLNYRQNNKELEMKTNNITCMCIYSIFKLRSCLLKLFRLSLYARLYYAIPFYIGLEYIAHMVEPGTQVEAVVPKKKIPGGSQ